ncbi:Efflux ABC transporter, permease protein [Streptomyces graminofaciens]|uniref:Efflux ABC transporter, permease protein n=1 Tax=Streptomyces graminofaciens TaxID=68212 RepID=A0ABM7FAM1_9ACTN|nr:ABC transporter permease [Streptomyces graminofaciens]BBC33027.1 Efflux ABC transporter, permease protein [Streptomyces graminofaciens]
MRFPRFPGLRLRAPRRHKGPTPTIPRSHLTLHDLLSEAVAGVLQRPGRSALTALGTVLGVGTFVAILGLTATASSQIDSRFTALTATEVTVEDTGGDEPVKPALSFPDDADRRIERLHGVEAAGVYWTVDAPAARRVRAAPVGEGARGDEVPVLAASPGVLTAARATLQQGRLFDSWHDRERQRVAVIGAGTAARLGITTLDTRPAVFIGEVPFTVIGVVADVERKADLLLSVVVPRTTAAALWGPPIQNRAGMLISTRIGAAVQIAEEAPLALRPDQPGHFKAVPPPDPRSLRTSVTSDLDQLFLVLAAICLVIGAVGIANTTLVAVLERTGEIGLRRSLGAGGRHILGQFLAESGALGMLGGLVGTSLGVLTVLTVAVVRDWTAVIHPGTVAAAPLIGLATGVLAGLYPAWRASRIEPAEALRR